MGRKTLYKAEYIEQVHNYALIGFTNVQIADAFDVSLRTLELWISKHPEFRNSMKAGKDMADGKVAMTLYKCAIGYVGPDGKYYPPNTTAIIFFLKNRQKFHWRDKQDIEHSGNITYKDLTDEELDHKIRQLQVADPK